MKFGRYLREVAVPAWRSQYINYKKLKQIIKLFHNERKETENALKKKHTFTQEEHDLTPSDDSTLVEMEDKRKVSLSMTEQKDRSESRKIGEENGHDDEVKQLLNGGERGSNGNGRWTAPNLHLDMAPELLDMFHQSNRHLLPHVLTSIQLIEDPATEKKIIVQVPHAFPHLADPSIRVSHKSTAERVSANSYNKLCLSDFIPKDARIMLIHEKFMQTLQDEIYKAVKFYCEQIKHFDEQVGLAYHCMREWNAIQKETDPKEKKKRLSKLPVQFQKGDRGIDKEFREIHYGLKLLQSFHATNYLAICKISKKHDKYAPDWKGVSEVILPLLETCEIYPDAEDLFSLVRALEKLYLDEVADPRGMSREVALTRIRAHSAPQESVFAIFFAGFSLGGILGVVGTAFVAFALSVSSFSSLFLENDANQSQLKTEIAAVIPVFRLMLLPSVSYLIWGINLLICEKNKINVRYIMSADPKSFLRSHQVIVISAVLMTFVIVGALLYIFLLNSSLVILASALIPLLMLSILILALIAPFKFFYHNTRTYLWRTMRNIISTPLFDVEIKHSFFADLWTSLSIVLLDLEYSLAYYFSGEFTMQSDLGFTKNFFYTRISLVLALVPFWWRFGQSMRLFFLGGKDVSPHSATFLKNSGKYLLSILATVFAYLYRFYNGMSLPFFCFLMRILEERFHWFTWIIFKSGATVVASGWDILMDWNIFEITMSSRSCNFKRTVLYSHVKAAFAILNTVLRAAFIFNFWLFTNPGILGANFNREFSILFLSLLEILRRGIWTTFKLENDNYKAIKKQKTFHEIHGDGLGIQPGYLVVHRQPRSLSRRIVHPTGE